MSSLSKRRYLLLILTAPLLVLGIGDVIKQRHEVANFNQEFGHVVALKRAPCSSGTNLSPCFTEVVEYTVDATHKNRIVSDVWRLYSAILSRCSSAVPTTMTRASAALLSIT
jgi:hypothetical protein